MTYFILLAGIAICLYSLTVICKTLPRSSPLHIPMPELRLLHELQSKVEEQLAELSRQKEIAAYLMVRMEEQLTKTKYIDSPLEAVAETEVFADSLERVQFRQEVFTLHDYGLPLEEIAQKVGRGKGEIALLLSLRK